MSAKLAHLHVLFLGATVLLGCSAQVATAPPASLETATGDASTSPSTGEQTLEKATFAAGCYWCTEAVFQRIEGVENVVSGFMGGAVENPSYKQVCLGTTGHAEVIQFDYDPARVSYGELLEVFWKTHDPTTLNRQGMDEGTQYRSGVFYHSDEQRKLAEKYKHELDESGIFENPIVTEITAASTFYAAMGEHQNFYNSNRYHGYCEAVIRPKIQKLEALFEDKLKSAQP